MSLAAMKLALEALEMVTVDAKTTPNAYEASRQAITALRAAIEQAQAPVTHTLNCVCGAVWDVSPHGVEEMVHAPTPPPRQWQGLTDQEIWSDGSTMDLSEDGIRNFARAIEAKLKEKNT